MPYWSSTDGVAVLATAMFVGGAAPLRISTGARAGPVPFHTAIVTSGFCQWVIVQSGSRKSMMLITNWLSWASSSGVSTARRQHGLDQLVRIADPLLADRLVGVVGDRQRVVEVDLLVALGERGCRRRRGARRVENGQDGRENIRVGERRDVQRGEAGVGSRRVAAVGREFPTRVVVGPDKVVGLPAIQREEPATALAVDGVGEADRGKVGEPAQQRRAVDVLRPVEPFEVGGADRGNPSRHWAGRGSSRRPRSARCVRMLRS